MVTKPPSLQVPCAWVAYFYRNIEHILSNLIIKNVIYFPISANIAGMWRFRPVGRNALTPPRVVTFVTSGGSGRYMENVVTLYF